MKSDELELGQRFVVDTIRDLAAKHDLAFEAVEWGQSREDFDRGIHAIVFNLNGKRHAERFTMEQLSDCPGDSRVRSEVESRLRRIVTAGVDRIGF